MENYKWVIYIIIGIIYFILKNKKKPTPVVNPEPAKNRETSPFPPRTSSVNNGKNERANNTRMESSKSQERKGLERSLQLLDYDDLITDEESKLVTPVINEADKERDDMFKSYQGKQEENEFGSLLKNSDSLKKAVIMSEILTPKHF